MEVLGWQTRRNDPHSLQPYRECTASP